ncbi:MAG: DUF4340 domain-containing protein [bacterium]
MSFRLTAILAGVLAVLIGVYFWAGRVGEKRRKAEEEKAHVVRIDAKKVVAIDLVQAVKQKQAAKAKPAKASEQKPREISLRKKDGTWRVMKPLALRADEDSVKDLLASLEEIKRDRVIDESAKDLSAFGLKPAKVTVRYELEGGGKGKILFGEASPSGEGVYMAVEGSRRVYLLPSTARRRFEKRLRDVRDKTILRRPRGEIAQITFERGGKRFALHKKGKEAWDLVEPIQAKGDIEAVNRTLELLLSGKAQRFLAETPTDADLSKYGLAPPRIRVTLAGAEGKNPDVFLIGKQDKGTKGHYARKEGTGPVFELERFSVDDLPKGPLEARTRRIFEFEKEAVEKIELEGPKGKWVIRMAEKDEWEVEGDGLRQKGNDRRISDMLWDIKYAKIAAFFDDPSQVPDPKGMEPVTRKVALRIKGKEKPLRFSVGQQGPSDPSQKDKEDQERWYARREADGAVFLLTRDTVDRISKGIWDLQERKAYSFKYNDVKGLRFGYPGGTVDLVKEGRRWRMMKPLDEIAVGDKLDFILNEIYFLEFIEVSEGEGPDFSKPDLVLDVTLREDKKLPTLRFVHDKKAKKLHVRRGEEKRFYTVEVRFLENVPKSYKGFLAKE